MLSPVLLHFLSSLRKPRGDAEAATATVSGRGARWFRLYVAASRVAPLFPVTFLRSVRRVRFANVAQIGAILAFVAGAIAILSLQCFRSAPTPGDADTIWRLLLIAEIVVLGTALGDIFGAVRECRENGILREQMDGAMGRWQIVFGYGAGSSLVSMTLAASLGSLAVVSGALRGLGACYFYQQGLLVLVFGFALVATAACLPLSPRDTPRLGLFGLAMWASCVAFQFGSTISASIDPRDQFAAPNDATGAAEQAADSTIRVVHGLRFTRDLLAFLSPATANTRSEDDARNALAVSLAGGALIAAAAFVFLHRLRPRRAAVASSVAMLLPVATAAATVPFVSATSAFALGLANAMLLTVFVSSRATRRHWTLPQGSGPFLFAPYALQLGAACAAVVAISSCRLFASNDVPADAPALVAMEGAVFTVRALAYAALLRFLWIWKKGSRPIVVSIAYFTIEAAGPLFGNGLPLVSPGSPPDGPTLIAALGGGGSWRDGLQWVSTVSQASTPAFLCAPNTLQGVDIEPAALRAVFASATAAHFLVSAVVLAGSWIAARRCRRSLTTTLTERDRVSPVGEG